MTSRKTTISSVLTANFGIEDFESGAVLAQGSESIASYDLSNKLGLLSALADRDNTDIVSFGSEAYDLLGEAKQLTSFATNQIMQANNRFSVAAEIKDKYSVEGFDPFAYGCEGFKDSMMNVITAVVAGIKKIIQSITNWIRQVMNWVGSVAASGQEKLRDKLKGIVSKSKDGTTSIKAIYPASKITSGEALIKPITETVIYMGKGVRANNQMALALLTEKTATVAGNTMNKTQYLSQGTSAFKKEAMTLKSFYGKKLDVVKIGTASKMANELVFGVEEPKKVTISATKFLSQVDWMTILSKKDLKTANEMVKFGKEVIKVLNESLKTADSLAKQMKATSKLFEKASAADKANNKRVKKLRDSMKLMTDNNRIGSLFAGVLYGTFANYLKLRSYTASAMRAIAKAAGSAGKKPKAGSNAAIKQKARAAFND